MFLSFPLEIYIMPTKVSKLCIEFENSISEKPQISIDRTVGILATRHEVIYKIARKKNS